MKRDRLTIRLDCGQMQCLSELKNKLNCSYSLMIRSIIGDFIKRNEDYLDRIITENEDEDDTEDYTTALN